MTEQEQRVAIAEVCGWQYLTHDSTFNFLKPPGDEFGYCCGKHLVKAEAFAEFLKPNKTGAQVPDYLHDLNAMHEVLRYLKANVMDGDQWEALGKRIEKAHPSACLRAYSATSDVIDYFDFATLLAETTAATLAEGVLRVLGKWRDP